MIYQRQKNSIQSNFFLIAIVVTILWCNIKGLSIFSTVQSLSKEESTEAIKVPHAQNVDDSSANELIRVTYPTSVLPDKVFTIIGLEASGTTFLADTIRKALHLNQIGSKDSYEALGEGYSKHYLGSDPNTQYSWTEIQHVSLPWGGMGCTQDPHQNVIPVLFPALCTKMMRDRMKMIRLLGGRQERFKDGPFVANYVSDAIFRKYKIPSEMQETFLNECSSHVGNKWTYPNRYTLNLTSHLDWYLRNGVDAKAIIIMRDTTISRRARQFHCTNPTLFEMEEELGREILEQTIHKYIHPPKGGGDGGQRRRLVHTSSDGKVVLLSYELLLQLKGDYLDVLYNDLGINSTFQPLWKDGNAKYVKGEPLNNTTNVRITSKATATTTAGGKTPDGSRRD